MLTRTNSKSPALKTGLSVVFFALMTGMAAAQDEELIDPPQEPGEELIQFGGPDVGDPPVDEGTVDCDPCDVIDGDPGEFFVIDPIYVVDGEVIDGEVTDGEVIEGEPINIDGIGDGEPLDPEASGEDIGGEVVIDDEVGEVIDVPVLTQEFPQSTCGGCEYENMAGAIPGGPEVQRTLTTINGGSDAVSESVSNNANICYDAALYIPLLCDWQRPFVGDLMP